MKKITVFLMLIIVFFQGVSSFLYSGVEVGGVKLGKDDFRMIEGFLHIRLEFFEKLGFQVNYYKNSMIVLLSKKKTEVQLKVNSNYCWIDQECFISKLKVRQEDRAIWLPGYDVAGWLGYKVNDAVCDAPVAPEKEKNVVESIFKGKKNARVFSPASVDEKTSTVKAVTETPVTDQWTALEKGVAYRKVMIGDTNRVVAHIIRIDRSSGVVLQPVLARNSILGKETLSEIICSYDGICGINGSFFDREMGIPLGLFVSEGKILSTPIYTRSAIGFKENGDIVMGLPEFRINIAIKGEKIKETINCVNQFPEKNGIMLYTSEYGIYTPELKDGYELVVTDSSVMGIGKGKSLIPPDGYVLVFTGNMKKYAENVNLFDTVSAENIFSGAWENTAFAIGGGPRLVREGEVENTAVQEKFKQDVASGKAPRSAIGVSKEGKFIYLVAVDGRQKKYSEGFTLDSLARFLKLNGCYNAINLDGGGSTAIAYRDRLLNRPSDKTLRKISNAIIAKRVENFRKYAYAY